MLMTSNKVNAYRKTHIMTIKFLNINISNKAILQYCVILRQRHYEGIMRVIS